MCVSQPNAVVIYSFPYFVSAQWLVEAIGMCDTIRVQREAYKQMAQGS